MSNDIASLEWWTKSHSLRCLIRLQFNLAMIGKLNLDDYYVGLISHTLRWVSCLIAQALITVDENSNSCIGNPRPIHFQKIHGNRSRCHHLDCICKVWIVVKEDEDVGITTLVLIWMSSRPSVPLSSLTMMVLAMSQTTCEIMLAVNKGIFRCLFTPYGAAVVLPFSICTCWRIEGLHPHRIGACTLVLVDNMLQAFRGIDNQQGVGISIPVICSLVCRDVIDIEPSICCFVNIGNMEGRRRFIKAVFTK